MAVVLVYGPDQGLVKERGDHLGRTVLDDLSDPFRVADLKPEDLKKDPARLDDEARAMSFGGGRRLIRVRGATDGTGEAVKNLLAGDGFDALVVIEAGDLPARSALRKLVEGNDRAAALPCYVDGGRDLETVIRETLQAEGLTVSREALGYLLENLGSDRLVSRGELIKLALYKGGGAAPEKEISLADAQAVIGDNGLTTLDDLCHAIGLGDLAKLDHSLERAFNEGQAPVAILRATQRHFQRLFQVSQAMGRGQNAEQAVGGLRPPVFFKWKSAFQAQANRWSEAGLKRALSILTEAEIDAKTTGLPDQALCARALMRIGMAARQAAAQRR
ncbi:MAG: DNA polymerase III subunit delta [Magnetovibrionaceae bacterium]